MYYIQPQLKKKPNQEHEDTHTCANTHTLYTQFLYHASSFDFNLFNRGVDTDKWLYWHYFTLQYQMYTPGFQILSWVFHSIHHASCLLSPCKYVFVFYTSQILLLVHWIFLITQAKDSCKTSLPLWVFSDNWKNENIYYLFISSLSFSAWFWVLILKYTQLILKLSSCAYFKLKCKLSFRITKSSI